MANEMVSSPNVMPRTISLTRARVKPRRVFGSSSLSLVRSRTNFVRTSLARRTGLLVLVAVVMRSKAERGVLLEARADDCSGVSAVLWRD